MLSDKRSGAKTQTFLQSTNLQLIVGFTKYPLLKIYYYNKYLRIVPSRQTEKTRRRLFWRHDLWKSFCTSFVFS